jgi:RHS repeat-associated protein
VTLTGVPDNKRVTVHLSNVNGAGVDVFASLGFLVGDVNNSRSVTATDILQVKGRSGQVTNATNFTFDLNASGSITASDILAVKGRSGQTVPAAAIILSVSKAGSGSGTVTSAPAGINCGADCAENYTSGTVVTLTAAASTGSTFSGWSGACTGTGTCVVTMDAAKSVSANFTLNTTGVPPDPSTVAPPTDPTSATSLASATSFLYTGPNPIQTGVSPGTIESQRAAVLRGKVQTRDGAALSGVTITILAHPEFGQTLSRADGAFDLAVNGGGQLTVNYQKPGFLLVQRAIVAPWRDYAWLPDVVMIPFDTAVTTVDLTAASMQTARGNPVSDAAGARRATILFPPGTTANLVLADGSTQPLTTLNVRATEFTVGDAGPNAMPAPLPPSSGYTYAVELSVDEVVAAGGTEVRFNQPLPVYVENFLGFPVGTAVPAGYYDRQQGQWIASANGRVIKVLSITAGLADLDIDGTGNAADAAALTALGVTDQERARLAQLYTPDQTLWRIPVTHFTPWDYNWPFGPPLDAVSPPSRMRNTPEVRRPTRRCGSVIGCEEQTLGESIPVTGTPWQLHYQSERTPGRREAYTLNIPVSEASVPPSLMTMRVQVNIAGRLYQATYGAAPNVVFSVLWDGLDGYGRVLYGEQTATVKVDYVYPLVHYPVDGVLQALAFGRAVASGAAIDSPRGVYNYTYSKTWTEKVQVRDLRRYGQGGWSLSVQHAYDPVGRKLLLGNGEERRGAALSQIINTVAGNGTYAFSGDGGPATAASFQNTHDVALGADGSLFIAEPGSGRVRRVGPDGIISTVAGNGLFGFSGDGGLATQTSLSEPRGIAVGSDGSLYIADGLNHRVRRVAPDGIITTVAGNGLQGNYNGDGGPATAAEVGGPIDVAIGPDGSLFIAVGTLIRRVGTDGIITTMAGNGIPGFTGDGGPATAAGIFAVRIAVGPDGSLFFADSSNRRIRRVGTDGIITTVAGSGDTGFSGDGGPATAANLTQPAALAVGPDGSLYIGDGPQQRVRRVGPDGVITTVAGIGPGNGYYGGDGGPATAAILTNYDSRGIGGIAVGPDNSLYVSDLTRIRVVRPVLPDFVVSDLLLPSEDGREIYLFSNTGRHLKTLDALTGGVRVQFGYDAEGYATTVTDGSGNVTTIERTGALATAIVAPGGKRTTLNVNAGGWLLSATNPAGDAHTMTYSSDGLLQTFTDPRAKLHQFTYDALGRLTKDEDPAGGSTTLARTEQSNGYTVTTTTALGRTNVYQVEQLSTDAVRRTVTSPSGTLTTTLINSDDSELTTYADGSGSTVKPGPDPRWGMLAPVAKSVIVTTPGGLTRTIASVRTATLSDLNNLMSLTNLSDTVTVNGAASSRVYSDNGTTRTLTVTTAAGRSSTVTLDALGRSTQAQVAGLDPVSYTYDSRGLPSTMTEGSGAGSRTTTLVFNAAYELTGATDAFGRTLGLAYDSAGRLVTVTQPGARTVTLAYDASGNTTALAPPGRSAHGFGYTPVDEAASYTPPDLGSGTTTTQISYDADRAPTRITRPDAQLVDVAYDTAGRASTVGIARGLISYSYSPATDQLTGVTAPGGLGLSYSYDSELLTAVTWSGAVTGGTAYTYNNDLQVTAEDVNAADSVSFAYNADGLLSTAGSLALTRNTPNGLLTGTTLGSVADSLTYSSLGELTNYSASYTATAIYNAAYNRDALGRITQKIETVDNTSATYGYSYDTAGRLSAVSKDAVTVSTYNYDGNGNRSARTGAGGPLSASYDAQDRLTSYGSITYSYTASGESLSKNNGAQTTTYQYDALGNLVKGTLPDGTVIDYLIDGENRRIGKKVNGTLVQGFLYQGSLRPIAELDGVNAVVSRFVYATHVNVPDYLIRDGVTYRIITDQLGSPRLVVDVATGNVAQRIDYDEFGQVLNDTHPGFQPFGFAGGLYDRDTKLVRFGARDYDAETGRWSAKDPIAFAGRDTNLYAYVSGDPVNFIDSSGLRRARVGDCLFIRSRGTRVLRNPSATSDPAMRGELEPGDEVRWLGYDSSTGFDRIEVTLPGGGTVEGYVLRQNLSPNAPDTQYRDFGRPMSSQAYASSGAGTKG